MKKKNLDKIDKDLLDRYIDEETLLAVKFEELDDGWQVSSTEKISAITELRLPIYYEEKPIVAIAKDGFKNATSLTQIELPESIQRIGEGAFSGCSSVKEFIVPESNKNFKVINGSLYDKSGATLIQYTLGKDGSTMTIPEGVQVIGATAVAHCQRIKEIVFPSTIKRILRGAFEGCVNLRSAKIPSSVVEVGVGAFKNCSKLNEVTLPEKLYYVRNSLFSGCKSLKEIDIPSSVLGVEDFAFKDCKKLKKVNYLLGFPPVLGEGVYSGCRGLEKEQRRLEKQEIKDAKRLETKDRAPIINFILSIFGIGWTVVKALAKFAWIIAKPFIKAGWWLFKLPFMLVKKMVVGIFNWIVDWFTLGEDLNFFERLIMTIGVSILFLPQMLTSMIDGLSLGFDTLWQLAICLAILIGVFVLYRKYIAYVWKGERGVLTLGFTAVMIGLGIFLDTIILFFFGLVL